MVKNDRALARAFSRVVRLGTGLVAVGEKGALVLGEMAEGEGQVVLLARDWRAIVGWARSAKSLVLAGDLSRGVVWLREAAPEALLLGPPCD